MKKFNWGIVGPGRISHTFATSLNTLDNAKLFAVSSRSKEKAESFAKEYNVPFAYEGVDDICENKNIDIVYIANINSAHKISVLKCLNAGMNVLCEKPIATNKSELEEMIAAAKKNDVFLMEATWTNFLPAIIKANKWIEEGKIGEIRMISSGFAFNVKDKSGRLFDKSLGGGALLDLAPYTIGVPYAILGKKPISITSNIYIGSTGVDEVSNVILNYENGVCVKSFCAITTTTPADMYIFGTKGSIYLPRFYCAETAELYIDEKLIDTFSHKVSDIKFSFEISEVMDCILKGKKESDTMPLSLSLSIIEVLDEVRDNGGLKYDWE